MFEHLCIDKLSRPATPIYTATRERNLFTHTQGSPAVTGQNRHLPFAGQPSVEPVHTPHQFVGNVSHNERVDSLVYHINNLFIDGPCPWQSRCSSRVFNNLVCSQADRQEDHRCNGSDDTIIRHYGSYRADDNTHAPVMHMVQYVGMAVAGKTEKIACSVTRHI